MNRTSLPQNIYYNAFFVIAILWSISACTDSTATSSPQEDVALPSPLPHFAYDLENPDTSFSLSNKLVEISGLSLTSKDENSLWAINDEQGNLYQLDASSGEIINTIDFGKKADYEGVEAVGDTIYIVKSSGTLYACAFQDSLFKKKYDTPLKTENDVEGLGYDRTNHRLLLACKAKAGKDIKEARAIYAFDIKTKQLLSDPAFIITYETIKSFVKTYYKEEWSLCKRAENFAPSAIAIHPKTGETYVLSSKGKMLCVLDEIGTLKNIQFMNPRNIRQPEGLCFQSDGTLWMSSEGAGAKAKLFRFGIK